MTWIEIQSQSDAAALMRSFGGFHDCCLREAHIWTEHSVGDDLAMTCSGNFDTKARILVQRQNRDPSAIELLFGEVTRFNLAPTPDNYDSIIFGAILLVQDGLIHWSPNEDWTQEACDPNTMSWVSARKLWWREASDLMGDTLRYGPGDSILNE